MKYKLASLSLSLVCDGAHDPLSQLKEIGIQNILALRGDPPKGQENFEAVEGGFACALDLVKYIRYAASQLS